MLELYRWGERFINAMLEVGDYLLYTSSGIPGLEDVSIAVVLFGGGLTLVLGYKLVKWILDIVL